MALEPDTAIQDIKIDRVFLGSCTNSRIEDLRAAAEVVKGRRVNGGVYAMVVPGSTAIKAQAEAEGLDGIFKDAGFNWREAGCSMCLGMNPDILEAGASAAHRPPTATSKGARARAAALTSSAPRWPPRRPSRATSWTSESGRRRSRRLSMSDAKLNGARVLLRGWCHPGQTDRKEGRQVRNRHRLQRQPQRNAHRSW